MKSIINKFNKQKCLSSTFKVSGLALAVALSSQASAMQLDFNNSKITGFTDTTVSLSTAAALENSNDTNTLGSSGRQSIFNSSGDIYNAPLSILTDVGVSYGEMGVFARGGFVYDFALNSDDNKCSSGSCGTNATVAQLDGVPDDARDESNKFELYDFFVYKNFDISDHILSVRMGKQVINWGESNFAGGGITQMINPVNLGKSTTPGSEVKERLLPQEMIYGNFEVSANTSLEAFYIWNWRKTEFFPVGTYFSPFDYQGEGDNPPLGSAQHTKIDSDDPDSGGQYGVTLHTILEDFDDMDLGFYYVRSHAHLPYLQAFDNGTYRDVYAEDQDTYALSLNGELGNTGVSFQTEINYKPDFYDTRSCDNSHGLAAPTVFPNTTSLTGCGVEAANVSTILSAFTYVGGEPLFGADKQAYIVDMAAVWIDGLDSNYVDSKNRPGIDGVDQLDRPITNFAYGYTLVASYSYNNLFWNLNVNPAFVYKHDVEGAMPFNHGAMTEGQRVIKASVTFDYQNTMSLNVAATKWDGTKGTFGDRDNIAATFKYSF